MGTTMTRIEVEAYDYVRMLTGKDSIMQSTKQTSVRLEINNLASVDALAEMGKRSRNQIINDALAFGLQLIRDQFEAEEKEQFLKLIEKQHMKFANEDEPDLKNKEK
jgi:predicted transcriptional regulator